MPYIVYILECSDGTYYTGTASDLSQRLLQHQQGAVQSLYTYGRRPVKLVWTSDEVEQYSEVLKWERQIKGWSRGKKQALIRNDFDAIHEIVREEREKTKLRRELRAERRNSGLLFRSRSVHNLKILCFMKLALRLRSSQQSLLSPLRTKCNYDNQNHPTCVYYPLRRTA